MSVIIPERKIALEYQNWVKPAIEKAFCNSSEVLLLTQIRDALLPKLISGKIRVPLTKENVEVQ
jgi:hypothetical protein